MSQEELTRVVTYVGASARQIRMLITDADGSGKDLSGFATSTVSARLGSTYKIEQAEVTIESGGTTGYVNFTPTAEEVPTAGDYRAMFKFITSGAEVDFSQEFIIEVRATIDQAPA